jgi:hypothetical protein
MKKAAGNCGLLHVFRAWPTKTSLISND